MYVSDKYTLPPRGIGRFLGRSDRAKRVCYPFLGWITMSNRFLPGLPAIDVEAQIEVNGVSATDVAERVWEKTAHRFYTPERFARKFAAYVGHKRNYTQEQITDLRWSIAQKISPHDYDDAVTVEASEQ